mgnify:CR=1 FL=1
MSNAPFKTDPIRTAIALAYRNEAFVADSILPRVPVGAQEFKWTNYNKEDRFTIPDTVVGRKGKVNEVEFGGTESSAMTADYGLEDVIPQSDIDAAANTGYDVKGNSTELLSDLIMLDREQRVANLVHSAASYPASNKESITGTDRWDTSTGNPIVQISDALEVPMMRPNVMVLSSGGSLAMRRNPAVVKAYHGNTGEDGLVPLSFIRELFELDEIVVGRARYNSAKPGQNMSLMRLWQSHCSLVYRNSTAMPNRGLTFGLTAEHGSRVSMSRQDGDIGLRGGERVRVGESVKELILANDCAYFFENIIG